MDIKTVLSEMTREEKMELLTGADNWHTQVMEQWNIPAVSFSDGPHGVRKEISLKEDTFQTEEAVCFPTASAVSATWNTDLTYRMGQALAGECIEHEVDILLGPGVNIKRSPACGRNFEYFSEDPVLSGKLGAAYIKGLQSRGIGACLKHFAGNSEETSRLYASSEMDERTLREVYLKAFEIAVKEAHPITVMCAYNRLMGVYCSQNPYLLKEILRDEWGFSGTVISDWGAVHDRTQALKASLELAMPYQKGHLEALKKAYETGELTDEEIDQGAYGVLKMVEAVELLKPLRSKYADTKEQRYELAYEIAAEAMTLLKNEEFVLPLDSKKCRKIAVIGGCAKDPFIQGGGSSKTNPDRVDGPLEHICSEEGFDVIYREGFFWWEGNDTPEIRAKDEALSAAADADAVLLFAGTGPYAEREALDRPDIRLHEVIERMIKDVCKVNQRVTVIVQAGSPIDMSAWIDDVKAVVWQWFTGSCGGKAVADLLFGRVCPSGKLAETFPLRLADTPCGKDFHGDDVVIRYPEGQAVGYRYYSEYEKNVCFCFGHGLSYTSFFYSDLHISKEKLQEGETAEVSLKVKNTGGRAGKETVQLYIREAAGTLYNPGKTLHGFCKVHLSPQEEKRITFTLNSDDFSLYSPVYRKWAMGNSIFFIEVGASSEDIRLTGKIRGNSFRATMV